MKKTKKSERKLVNISGIDLSGWDYNINIHGHFGSKEEVYNIVMNAINHSTTSGCPINLEKE